jgi:hypothetical protein
METQRRRRGKRGRRKNKEFMDAALDAYIRHLALEKWREVNDLREAADLDSAQAVGEVGHFHERGVYRDLWERCWQREVVAQITGPMASLLGCIEIAIQGAVREEIEARQQCGDVTLEDTPAYKRFLDLALDRLFEEEAGSLEEL